MRLTIKGATLEDLLRQMALVVGSDDESSVRAQIDRLTTENHDLIAESERVREQLGRADRDCLQKKLRIEELERHIANAIEAKPKPTPVTPPWATATVQTDTDAEIMTDFDRAAKLGSGFPDKFGMIPRGIWRLTIDQKKKLKGPSLRAQEMPNGEWVVVTTE